MLLIVPHPDDKSMSVDLPKKNRFCRFSACFSARTFTFIICFSHHMPHKCIVSLFSPSFSRCDLVVVANGWKEKIASGLTICVVI